NHAAQAEDGARARCDGLARPAAERLRRHEVSEVAARSIPRRHRYDPRRVQLRPGARSEARTCCNAGISGLRCGDQELLRDRTPTSIAVMTQRGRRSPSSSCLFLSPALTAFM